MMRDNRKHNGSTTCVAIAAACLWTMLLCCAPLVLAQEPTVSITSYYPTPYGAYRSVRLYPGTCGASASCSTPGAMCLSSTNYKLYTCRGNPSTWGVGFWNYVPGTNNIYYALSGRVGIGTGPTAKLSVRGKTDICMQMEINFNSGRQRCPTGYAIVTPESLSPINYSCSTYRVLTDSFYCCRTCYRNGTVFATAGFLNFTSFPSSYVITTDDNNNGICDN